MQPTVLNTTGVELLHNGVLRALSGLLGASSVELTPEVAVAVGNVHGRHHVLRREDEEVIDQTRVRGHRQSGHIATAQQQSNDELSHDYPPYSVIWCSHLTHFHTK